MGREAYARRRRRAARFLVKRTICTKARGWTHAAGNVGAETDSIPDYLGEITAVVGGLLLDQRTGSQGTSLLVCEVLPQMTEAGRSDGQYIRRE